MHVLRWCWIERPFSLRWQGAVCQRRRRFSSAGVPARSTEARFESGKKGDPRPQRTAAVGRSCPSWPRAQAGCPVARAVLAAVVSRRAAASAFDSQQRRKSSRLAAHKTQHPQERILGPLAKRFGQGVASDHLPGSLHIRSTLCNGRAAQRAVAALPAHRPWQRTCSQWYCSAALERRRRRPDWQRTEAQGVAAALLELWIRCVFAQTMNISGRAEWPPSFSRLFPIGPQPTPARAASVVEKVDAR